MVAKSQSPFGNSAKISLIESGCGCRRRISKIAWRGPVIRRDLRRNFAVNFGRLALLCSCGPCLQ